MAERPVPELLFDTGDCADCGARRTQMPPLPVRVPADIDLGARDFEGFRRLMLESLGLDNPDRSRWSQADMEVMLVELLAAALDRMSHSLDTVFAERFLETAQWPVSVVRLLTMIDAVDPARAALRAIMRPDEIATFFDDASGLSEAEQLFAVLSAHPQLIGLAKSAALAGVNRFEACLTLDDMRARLEEVPIFADVAVRHVTEGGISVYEASVLFVQEETPQTPSKTVTLLMAVKDLPPNMQSDFRAYFKTARDRLVPSDAAGGEISASVAALDESGLDNVSVRAVMHYLLGPLLPLGMRLRLVAGKQVGIYMRLCVEVAPNYFRSEVELAVREVLSARPGGLFEQKRLGFGVALKVSDIEEALMALPGVVGVIISRLQIVGDPGSEASGSGVLQPAPDQALQLRSDRRGPESGYYVLKLSRGLVG